MNEQPDLPAIRHSLAHLLAATVIQMYPGSKNAIGPAIEDGFYQDFDTPHPVSDEELPKIEAKMREILKNWGDFERREVTVEEARQEFAWNPYKLELIDDLAKEGHQITLYTSGDFVDLCRGGHVTSSQQINPHAFKLVKVSGAYWRADQTKQQLQRIYGVAFRTPQELDAYLQKVEEAKKRDHRKLGQELDLFTFSDLVGPGLPLYTPRGTILIEELKNVLREISKEHDMQLVSIPHLAKIDLYKMSGHADKFSEELFHVRSHHDQEFILKPVNCPHHTQIYAAKPRSYRDLPLRYIEQTMQYRDEKPGQLGGLQRTRGFTVDDGHTFCRVDQIREEALVLVDVIKQFYENLGLWGSHWVSLSVRDPAKPDAYIGEPHDWEIAESMLAEVAEVFELDAKRMEGEAALYGPKIDFMFKDALGRETQLATVQLDFAMPKRFGLTYIDAEGVARHPIMIHRAILGSFERFIMLLIEHFAGKFPVWLSPEQLRLITINQQEATLDFAKKIANRAKEHDLRVYIDASNESVSKKIRNSELMKIPYTVVVGAREIETEHLTPRIRTDMAVEGRENKSLELDQLLRSIAHEAQSRAVTSSL